MSYDDQVQIIFINIPLFHQSFAKWIFKNYYLLGMVGHAFNISTQAEAGHSENKYILCIYNFNWMHVWSTMNTCVIYRV